MPRICTGIDGDRMIVVNYGGLQVAKMLSSAIIPLMVLSSYQ